MAMVAKIGYGLRAEPKQQRAVGTVRVMAGPTIERLSRAIRVHRFRRFRLFRFPAFRFVRWTLFHGEMPAVGSVLMALEACVEGIFQKQRHLVRSVWSVAGQTRARFNGFMHVFFGKFAFVMAGKA